MNSNCARHLPQHFNGCTCKPITSSHETDVDLGGSFMPASAEVAALAGDLKAAGLNYVNTGGGCYVVTAQVDNKVFVVGQDDYGVAEIRAVEWAGLNTEDEDPIEHLADDAPDTLTILTDRVAGATKHQCGCSSWIHVRPGTQLADVMCGECGRTQG